MIIVMDSIVNTINAFAAHAQQACTLVMSKELKEFEMWIKYTNYRLFLEHAHSYEYYKQRQLYYN